MQKAYTKTNWQNLPSKTTALGATNLNKLENGVNAIDDRVIAMDVAKADLSTVNTLVKTISFNETTGIFTITLQNGAQTTIDTALEKIAVNFAYNSETQQIELTLIDGTVQYIDVSDFIANVDFETSETIQFIEKNGKTKAEILDGSITDIKLQPNYLADITVQAERGLAYADEAQRYAVGGVVPEDVEDNAKYYKEKAEIAHLGAETARSEAEAIVGIGIAEKDKLGLVKGNGGVSIRANGDMFADPYLDVDTQSGASIQSIVAENALVELTQINGATTVIPTNPDLDISPDNVATITSAKDFDVVACGKNLFDKTILNRGWYNSNGIFQSSKVWNLRELFIASNTNLTFSGLTSSGINDVYICGKDKYGVVIPIVNIGNKTLNTSDYVSILYSVHDDSLETTQLELGSNPTPYEPYKSNKLTITKELNKLENGVADTRERIDDKYVKYTHRIKRSVFDGSEDENWAIAPSVNPSSIRFILNDSSVRITGSRDKSILCDKFKSMTWGEIYSSDITTGNGISTYDQGGRIVIRIEISKLATQDVAGFKAFLQANPIEVLYELAEPIETIVEESSMLTSYKGVANIYTTANPQVEFTANFKSRAWMNEQKKYDDNKPIEFTESATDVNIASGETAPTIFGKILKSINTLRDGLANKISVSKIVNTTAVTEAGFVPDALLVKENAQAISTLTNKLANQVGVITLKNNVSSTGSKISKVDKNVIFYLDISVVTSIPATTWTEVATLPSGYIPAQSLYSIARTFDYETVDIAIGSDGSVKVRSNVVIPIAKRIFSSLSFSVS